MAAVDPYAAAVQTWLALVDKGQYAESWTGASAYFRQAIAEPTWIAAVKAARDPLGALTARSLKSATTTTSLPGAPDGEYEVLQFQSSFADKTGVLETVTLKREGDAWKVAGSFIK
jgi:hypothetical protein